MYLEKFSDIFNMVYPELKKIVLIKLPEMPEQRGLYQWKKLILMKIF